MELKDFEISRLEVKDDEIVVLKINYKNTTASSIKRLYDGFNQIFPRNQVVIIPSDMEVSTMSKQELIKHIKDM
ncbi:hypothetical protein [uncultured Clostridium sp.]|uniref:hypothetical protein n=1 Tax=uncultured Clostridium sp. TaxID=59620 RepID=UPI003217E27F